MFGETTKKASANPAVGDVVQLKSGGASMTVEKLAPVNPGAPPSDPPNPGAHCVWMDTANRVQKEVFALTVLAGS